MEDQESVAPVNNYRQVEHLCVFLMYIYCEVVTVAKKKKEKRIGTVQIAL